MSNPVGEPDGVFRQRHYEIATDEPAGRRLAVVFTELAEII
jgi:hypothetical protein